MCRTRSVRFRGNRLVGINAQADVATRAGHEKETGGTLELAGRAWQEDGHPVSEILERSAEGEEGAFGRLLLLEGRTAAESDAPQLYGTGEIRMESAERASGYWTTRAETHPKVDARTSGVYLRADPVDMSIVDGDHQQRAELIAERLRHWKAIKTA